MYLTYNYSTFSRSLYLFASYRLNMGSFIGTITKANALLRDGDVAKFTKLTTSHRGIRYSEQAKLNGYGQFADMVVRHAPRHLILSMLANIPEADVSYRCMEDVISGIDVELIKDLLSAKFVSTDVVVGVCMSKNMLQKLKDLSLDSADTLNKTCLCRKNGELSNLLPLTIAIMNDRNIMTRHLLEHGEIFNEQCLQEYMDVCAPPQHLHNIVHETSFHIALKSNPAALTSQLFLQLCSRMPVRYIKLALELPERHFDVNYTDPNGCSVLERLLQISYTKSEILLKDDKLRVDARKCVLALLHHDKHEKWGRECSAVIYTQKISQVLGNNRTRVLKNILGHGVDVNERDKHGKTLLFYARFLCDVQVLVEYGFDPNCCDFEGNSARTTVLSTVHERMKRSLKQYLDRGIARRSRLFCISEERLSVRTNMCGPGTEMEDFVKFFDKHTSKLMPLSGVHETYKTMLQTLSAPRCIHPADLATVLQVQNEKAIDWQTHRQWWFQLGETDESWSNYIDRGVQCTKTHDLEPAIQSRSFQDQPIERAQKRAKIDAIACIEQFDREL